MKIDWKYIKEILMYLVLFWLAVLAVYLFQG